jgi:hypothetical protein
MEGKLIVEDGKQYMLWKDNKIAKLGKSIYSIECSKSKAHNCKHCNPTKKQILSKIKK